MPLAARVGAGTSAHRRHCVHAPVMVIEEPHPIVPEESNGNPTARQRAAALDRHRQPRAERPAGRQRRDPRAGQGGGGARRLRAEPVRAQPAQRPHRHRRGGDSHPHLRLDHRFGPLHHPRGRAPHPAPARARPDRALPRPGRGRAGEPAAHGAAAHRRRGHHQPDHRPRPPARLPQGVRPRLRRLRPQRRDRGLSLRRLRLRVDGARGGPPLRRATGTGGWRWR